VRKVRSESSKLERNRGLKLQTWRQKIAYQSTEGLLNREEKLLKFFMKNEK